MKITKDNYNELRKKELENNYAKVWHVNEIREELLANSGGTTTKDNYFLPTGEGDITVTTNAGIVTIEQNLNNISTLNFNLITPDITVDTVLLITVTNDGGLVLGVTYNIITESANVTLSNRSGSQATGIKVHFLII
jgi:hypothetical protein